MRSAFSAYSAFNGMNHTRCPRIDHFTHFLCGGTAMRILPQETVYAVSRQAMFSIFRHIFPFGSMPDKKTFLSFTLIC